MIQVIKFILDIVWNIIEAILEAIFDFIKGMLVKERKTIFDADYSHARELMSTRGDGFTYGKFSTSLKESTMNAIVYGGSGSHKSTSVLLPSIWKMRGRCSQVINNPSGELRITAGALEQANHTVLVLNPARPEISQGFNPLLRKKTATEIAKVSKMALACANSKYADPFWLSSGESLLTLMCRVLKECTEPQYHTLYNAYHLISVMSYSNKLDNLFAKASAPLVSEYMSFLKYAPNTLSSVIATVRAALSIFFNDPGVALVTSFDSIDMDLFRTKNVSLFLENSVVDMRYYSVLTNLFLDEFYATMLSRIPAPGENPIFFYLDEASSLTFNNLNVVMSNIRKHAGGLMLIYQSYHQVIDQYGPSIAKAINDNSYAKCFMPAQPLEVSKDLSALLGSFEYEDEKGRHVRQLALPSEVHEMDASLLFLGNARAVKEKLTPFFLQPDLKRLANIPASPLTSNLPFSTPPLLPLE